MDAQELRNLQEAYMEVYSELDEGFKKFPSKKVYKQAERKLDKRKPTGLRFDNVEGQVNTMMDTRANFRDKKHYDAEGEAKAASAANRNRPASQKRSKTISDNSPKKFPNRLRRSDGQGIHDSYDYYDIILSHLLDEGYADTQEAAESIMVNMSEEWRDSIKEEYKYELGEGYELEESSSGERSGRRTRGKVTLARGRGADMTRQERTTAAIAKKAGLKGTGKYSTKDLRTTERHYDTYDSEDDEDDIGSTEQDHRIRTHSSARKAAEGERLIRKYKPVGKTTRLKTAPSSESIRRVRDLKKQMTKAGANKRGRVHTVDIMHRDSDVGKGDKDQQMERGRNFIKALKDTPKHLKAAGAKKGETVIGKPTAVMPGEDQKTGVAKRAKLYKKVFGKKSSERSPKTGLMTGKVG